MLRGGKGGWEVGQGGRGGAVGGWEDAFGCYCLSVCPSVFLPVSPTAPAPVPRQPRSPPPVALSPSAQQDASHWCLRKTFIMMIYHFLQIARMQRRLSEVWHRFAYATGGLLQVRSGLRPQLGTGGKRVGESDGRV